MWRTPVYHILPLLLTLAALCGAAEGQAPDPIVLHISPAGADANPGTADQPIQSFSRLQARLAEMPRVTEVVFHKGIYRGGLALEPLKDTDPAKAPLLLHAAEGEEVIFDGAGDLGDPTPIEGKPGVFAIRHEPSGGE